MNVTFSDFCSYLSKLKEYRAYRRTKPYDPSVMGFLSMMAPVSRDELFSDFIVSMMPDFPDDELIDNL
jgi:hypothetical protein